jgi:seryl-tRNA(Sec) selenium transferase
MLTFRCSRTAHRIHHHEYIDPDIVTERARALLNMAHANDILVMVDPVSGKPISGKFQELIDAELISIIQADSTL